MPLPLGVEGGGRGEGVARAVGVVGARAVDGDVPAGEGLAGPGEGVGVVSARAVESLVGHRFAGRAVAVEGHGLARHGSSGGLNDDGPHCPCSFRGRWSCGWCVDGISGQCSVE